MLNEKYFEDAFALHDVTVNQNFELKMKKNTKLISKLNQNNVLNNTEIYNELFSANKQLIGKDYRNELSIKWASFLCSLKLQPLNLIREYFGEKVALYFAWSGMLIATLWLPSLVGIVFFGVGLKYRLYYFFVKI